MRIVSTCIVWLLAVISMGLSARTLAHPGHDHSIPSAVWQEDHEEVTGDAGSTELAAINTGNAADDPRISAWKLADGTRGTSSVAAINNVVSQILGDINTVAYNANYVFVRTTGVPSHAVGDDANNNPSVPGDVDATYRISCNPTEQLGTKTSTGLGAIGVMVNGTGFYNASDGTYWRPNTNTLTNPGGTQPPNSNWSTNALWYRAVEQGGIDNKGGHPSPVNGQTNPDGSQKGFYHYHQSPFGLLEQIDPGNEGEMGSPIVGFAFDGYPVVGPFAYADETMTSAIQMQSSYGVYDNRDSFPTPKPTVEDYAMGSFLEDFVYLDGSGNLNEYNMAFVKFSDDGRAILTDETDPDGDWAYFATTDAIDASHPNDIARDGGVAYPYITGPEFFGVVDTAMTMPGGSINVPGNVTYHFEYEHADFDADTDVDGTDFLAWQLGQSPDPQGSSDLLNWETQFGSSPPPLSAAVSVPEPLSLALLASSGIALLGTRHRNLVRL